MNKIIVVLCFLLCISCSENVNNPLNPVPIQYDYLFLGDSIIALGNWESQFDNMLNKGISGSTAENWVSYRMIDDVDNYCSIAFICLGVNDLGKGYSIQSTISNYKTIINYLKSRTDKIYVLSVMSINISLYTQFYGYEKHAVNMPDSLVVSFNSNLQNMVIEMDINYIDTYSTICSNGEMKSNYTDDGIHPNETGYNIIYNILKESL